MIVVCFVFFSALSTLVTRQLISSCESLPFDFVSTIDPLPLPPTVKHDLLLANSRRRYVARANVRIRARELDNVTWMGKNLFMKRMQNTCAIFYFTQRLDIYFSYFECAQAQIKICNECLGEYDKFDVKFFSFRLVRHRVSVTSKDVAVLCKDVANWCSFCRKRTLFVAFLECYRMEDEMDLAAHSHIWDHV